MASTKLYDLCVKLYSFTRPDGTNGNKYANIGSVMQKDDGGKYLMIDRHFNPAGVPNPDNRTNVLVSIFEPRDPNHANANGFNQPPQTGMATGHPARTQPAHTQTQAPTAGHTQAQAYGALSQPQQPHNPLQPQQAPPQQQPAPNFIDDDIPF